MYCPLLLFKLFQVNPSVTSSIGDLWILWLLELLGVVAMWGN